MRNFLYKIVRLAVRASTKTTFLFFTAIAATIGGGLLSVFHHPSPVPVDDYAHEERVPASSHRAPPPPFSGAQGARSRFLPAGGGGMPANYDERVNAQSQGSSAFSGGERVDASQLMNQSAEEVQKQAAQARSLAESAQGRLEATATSTSTGTGTETSTSTDSSVGFTNGGPTATSTSSDTSTSTSTSARYIVLNAEGVGFPGLCIPLTLTFYNTSFVATAPGSDVTVSVFTDAGALYSDAACSTGTTSVTVAAASTSSTFYFRHTATGTATVRAEHTSYSSSSQSITLSIPAAELALGQADFTGNTANRGGAVAAGTLNQPYRTVRTGTKLLAADAVNNRVLIWNTLPTASGQDADLALGQPGLVTDTANNGGISAATLSQPTDVHTDGTRLFVADAANNRVLIWNTIPTASGTAADLVLGQPDMDDNTANQGGAASLATLSDPECVFTDGTRLLVCDTGNHRVLIWSSIPTADNQPADIVVGQSTVNGVAANQGGAVSGAGLDAPYFAIFSGSRLLVSDTNNSRVLVWNSIPTSHGAGADVALGQTSLTTNVASSGGVSASSMGSSAGLAVDSSGRLAVVDFTNHRVLIWNSIPSAHFTASDSVVGQPTATANAANNGGISSSTLNGPWGVDISGTELWVTDWGNHRLLQFAMP